MLFSTSDINECSTGNGGCNQVCINVIGSFQCSCNAGYELDSDQRTCIGMCSVLVCTCMCVYVCVFVFVCMCVHDCVDVRGQHYMHSYSNSHADTNECGNRNGGCAQSCHNTAGSYYCVCGSGYTLSSNSHGCNGEHNDKIMYHVNIIHHATVGLQYTEYGT